MLLIDRARNELVLSHYLCQLSEDSVVIAPCYSLIDFDILGDLFVEGFIVHTLQPLLYILIDQLDIDLGLSFLVSFDLASLFLCLRDARLGPFLAILVTILFGECKARLGTTKMDRNGSGSLILV